MGEELRLEDEEENANKQDEELIKKEKNSEENQNENDKPEVKAMVSPEHIELVKTESQEESN